MKRPHERMLPGSPTICSRPPKFRLDDDEEGEERALSKSFESVSLSDGPPSLDQILDPMQGPDVTEELTLPSIRNGSPVALFEPETSKERADSPVPDEPPPVLKAVHQSHNSRETVDRAISHIGSLKNRWRERYQLESGANYGKEEGCSRRGNVLDDEVENDGDQPGTSYRTLPTLPSPSVLDILSQPCDLSLPIHLKSNFCDATLKTRRKGVFNETVQRAKDFVANALSQGYKGNESIDGEEKPKKHPGGRPPKKSRGRKAIEKNEQNPIRIANDRKKREERKARRKEEKQRENQCEGAKTGSVRKLAAGVQQVFRRALRSQTKSDRNTEGNGTTIRN